MVDLAGRKKTIVAVAAVSVLAIGAVTAAVLTGVIPQSTPVTTPESSTPPAGSAESAAKVRPRVAVKSASAPTEVAGTAVPPPPPCSNCGVVESIESFTEKGKPSGGGAVAGGLIGGILGHQIGAGRGKDLATVAGAVGGAIAGNEIEKNANKVTGYHVGVRMNDGTRVLLTFNAAPNIAVGDHVRVVNGELVRD